MPHLSWIALEISLMILSFKGRKCHTETTENAEILSEHGSNGLNRSHYQELAN